MGQGTAGKESEVHVSNDDGSTWVSVATTSISPDTSLGEVDTSEHGNDGNSRITTIFDASLGLEANYRPGTGTGQDEGQKIIRDAYFAQTDLLVRYFPLGSADDGFQFGGHVNQLSIPSDATGKVSMNANINQNDGNAVSVVSYAAPS